MDLTPFLSEPLILLVLGFLALGPIATVARRVPLAFKLSAGVLRYAALVLALPDRFIHGRALARARAELNDIATAVSNHRTELHNMRNRVKSFVCVGDDLAIENSKITGDTTAKKELLAALSTVTRHLGCPVRGE